MKFKKRATDPVRRNTLICNESGECINKLDFAIKNLLQQKQYFAVKILILIIREVGAIAMESVEYF
jgi:hypothetical protein